MNEGQGLRSVMVVGGCGFLGREIVKMLLDDPTKIEVSVFDRVVNKNVFEGVEYVEGDICEAEDVKNALDKLKPQVIIHTASLTPGHVSYLADQKSKFIKVNINGTANLLKHAKESPFVSAFVYTSTLSVMVSPSSFHIDETYPIHTKITTADLYGSTKALAETLVTSSNSRNHPSEGGLLTAAIRLGAIYGPGDLNTTWPTYVKIQNKQTGVQIGDGKALMDFVHVTNVSHAHILAAKALVSSHPNPSQTPTSSSLSIEEEKNKVDGEVFFISDDEPMSFWEWSRKVWKLAGHEAKEEEVRAIPPWFLVLVCLVAEWLFWVATWGKYHPRNLRRVLIGWCYLDRCYSIEKAKERLGYTPKISGEEGRKTCVEWGKKYQAELNEREKSA